MDKLKVTFFTIFILLSAFVYHRSKNCQVVDGKKHIYKGQCLSKDYKPENLVDLPDRANYLTWPHQLSKIASDRVTSLILDAEKDGMCLVVMGGYRSPELQQKLFDETPIEKQKGVAKAFESEHQTGLAVDFVACPFYLNNGKAIRDDSIERLDLKNEFETLPEYEWLRLNAFKYGFEQTFTEENEDITGYPAEAWHWKLVLN